ncbi:tRNA 2-thiouridine(34) synthase MnmA [Candidatus Kaiserbacteria bacterium]|nr:tRNA 2-thiouridine(34) synthase MnmA [Candidatus Kaiserbacteria bacterium]
MKKRIFVGLSGGVDSSVAAYRLREQGHEVIGVFIKTWQPDFIQCTWETERLDAMRVAAHLNIPFLTFDAVDAYKTGVAEYMISEYAHGRTPNPDVMCNQHVKFGAFLEFARSHGADAVATGHYAQISHDKDGYHLLRGKDREKDQSYFLWTLTQDQLRHIVFPVGDLPKKEVRRIAKKIGLPTAVKKDSQGICFLGQIDMRDFLGHYVDLTEGAVLDTKGIEIGMHAGALLYTYGQRHGFTITEQTTSTKPHYVIAKDLDENTITVSEEPPIIQDAEIVLEHVHEIQPCAGVLSAQLRYRGRTYKASLEERVLAVKEEVPKPASGQSCVLYREDECLGGGIIV